MISFTLKNVWTIKIKCNLVNNKLLHVSQTPYFKISENYY